MAKTRAQRFKYKQLGWVTEDAMQILELIEDENPSASQAGRGTFTIKFNNVDFKVTSNLNDNQEILVLITAQAKITSMHDTDTGLWMSLIVPELIGEIIMRWWDKDLTAIKTTQSFDLPTNTLTVFGEMTDYAS